MSNIAEVTYTGAILNDVADVAGVTADRVAMTFEPSRSSRPNDDDVLRFDVDGVPYAFAFITDFHADRDANGDVIENLVTLRFCGPVRRQ